MVKIVYYSKFNEPQKLRDYNKILRGSQNTSQNRYARIYSCILSTIHP